MIRGLHGLIYSSDAAASRAFVRDKLQLPSTDIGEGWLIFDLPEGDLGFHPLDHGGTAGAHDVSFYCDDIHDTVAELRGRGVEFQQDPQDHGYGWVTYFTIPGGITVQLYEPRYEKKQQAVKKVATRVKAAAVKVRAKAKAAVKKAVKKTARKKKQR